MPTQHPAEGGRRTVLWWRAAGPLAVMLVVTAVSLAACGGSPSNGAASRGSTTTTSSSSAAAQGPAASALRFANCMRSNGVTNYPDPSSNGRPQTNNQIDRNSPTFLRAYKACQKYAPIGEGGPPCAHSCPTALCPGVRPMHAQARVPAVPGPASDPLKPDFTLGRGMYFPLNSTTDGRRRRWRSGGAAKACGVQLPVLGPP